MIIEKSMKPLFGLNSTYTNESERDKYSNLEVQRMFNIYDAAMKVISTKLEILESEFRVMGKHNPIHHIESRLKSSESIVRKLKSKGLDCVLSNITQNIFDVVGLRIVCPYLEDVYVITDMLLSHSDITLLRKKDYIKNPKPNGYRSMHLVILIPVVLYHGTEQVPVEIQIRTIAMDMWASLEHELYYKTNRGKDRQIEEKLFDCSEKLAAIDIQMGEMFDNLKRIDERNNLQLMESGSF
jgi:putative GTP pyrophosphokinase